MPPKAAEKKPSTGGKALLARLPLRRRKLARRPQLDTGLLVVTGSVTRQLENLSSKVLENGSKVNRGT